MLSYINKKGKTVELTLTKHSYFQFIKRYRIAFPKRPLLTSNSYYKTLEVFFNDAEKVKKISKKENIRLKKYGNDTMFFRTNFFTFIVQNKQIVTIELSNKDMRYLN